MKQHNIFLIGPMGAGKTTVGRQLAKKLGLSFYDSDKEIEAHAGATVAWIFDKEGEAGFRKREEQAIANLSKLKNVVVATGGGAILSAHNRALLMERGTVIYLQVSLRRQLARVGRGRSRPLLNSPNPMEILKALQAKRESLYQKTAHMTFDTDNFSAAIIVKQIISHLQADKPL